MRKVLLALLIGALALPLSFGAYYSVLSSDRFTVAVSAPESAGGLTLAVAVPSSPLRAMSGDATYSIRFNGETVYPPGGQGATFSIKDGRGSVFIPYRIFVVGNGEYEVVVTFQDGTERSRSVVQKWVNYVFLAPFDRGSRVAMDILLTRSMGAGPSASIQTGGDLFIDVRYRGADGGLNVPVTRMKYFLTGDDHIPRIEVPKSALSQGPGFYSFDATFYNDQALGNNGVRTDPSLAKTNPPRNWYWHSG